MKNFVKTICFTLCLGFSLPVLSEDGASLFVSRGCTGCHGVGGNAPAAPTYPKIGMQNKEYTINQLKDFKTNKRSNGMAALMAGMVAALSEEDMQKLADYLSVKPDVKSDTMASSTDSSVTDTSNLYFEKSCIACHGANGINPVMDAYPEIGGQSEVYLLAQMKDIKTGARNNSHSIAMTNIMSNVTDDDMAAIATWLSKQSR